MATYYTGSTSLTNVQQPHSGIGIHTAYDTFDLAVEGGGVALALNDVIKMVKVPKDAVILGVTLTADDLDSSGSPAIVLDVGDTDATDDTDRYIDGATIGQAGGITATMNSRAGFLYQFAAEGTIDVLVQVAPATGATTGKIKLAVHYSVAQN